MEKRTFENWRDLARLDYFELLDDGRLAMVVDGLDGFVDFHTHFGWTFLIAPAIDLTARAPGPLHNFEPQLPLNLDLYSGEDFYNVRPKWAKQDYIPCALSPLRRGKHTTHTVPNLLWEMDALKIEKSVSLCLDLTNSGNSRRAVDALRDEPRVVFYCCVHPKDKRAEPKVEEYIAGGALGIKMHPEMHRTAIDDEAMLNFARLWCKFSGGMPMLAHSGFNGFEPKKVREHAAIEKYYPLAEVMAENDTPFILGHAAMNQYRKAAEIAQKFPNVYLEVSGQPPAHLRDMLDMVGDERILYGTDWPVYPQAIPMAKVFIATEDAPQSRIKIMRDNAMKLIQSAQESQKKIQNK